ncbi:hypothetical protein GO755_28200 [Spirosoma sp. HMF4905]|uniref:Uncharacterized protein n=1 Tax=Spirosoma arboris TaxID=2682092 RepID=A0A7K1SJG9_9BACT|nr:hypothetical protein [Spirosoma arboris]MVM33950.1 hypothetical protein [Spirosoma arboris]
MDQVSYPLFCSVYGQITYCCYSAEYSIDFGALQIWVCQERLRQFACRINQLVQVKSPLHQSPFSHTVDICPPNCDGEAFRFAVDELIDLQTLLNGALVMIDFYQFLDANLFRIETSS